MVGRGDQHEGVGVVALEPDGGAGDGRGGVAGDRLDEEAGKAGADLARLVLDDEAVLFGPDDQRGAEARPAAEPRQRVLEQRAAAGQAEELLGETDARGRPEPRARAAGKDDGNDRRRVLRSQFPLHQSLPPDRNRELRRPGQPNPGV